MMRFAVTLMLPILARPLAGARVWAIVPEFRGKEKRVAMGRNLDWDRLRVFHAVAEAGSLTHAGETLNLSQSAVSRQIRHLEEALGVTLFHRHARGLILTEQGELLHEATRAMMQKLESTAARIRDAEDAILGRLRVTTTTGFGTLWLAPRLGRLFDLYPDLDIQLLLEERVLDLAMREADVAIRMKEPSQSDLIRRRLMDIRIRLYASTDYVARNGMPETLADLRDHRLLLFTIDSPQVGAGRSFMQRFLDLGASVRLSVNSYFGVLQGGAQRAGDRGAAGIPGRRPARAGAGAARRGVGPDSGLFRLSAGAAPFPGGWRRSAISSWPRSAATARRWAGGDRGAHGPGGACSHGMSAMHRCAAARMRLIGRVAGPIWGAWQAVAQHCCNPACHTSLLDFGRALLGLFFVRGAVSHRVARRRGAGRRCGGGSRPDSRGRAAPRRRGWRGGRAASARAGRGTGTAPASRRLPPSTAR
ncbi:MAG: hypothetical protein KatS3mg118_1141 [Paracoccaceae bacterium]|nr:MAG: hypothetical protein KatS3mg118_1141 [Paracoccaceae bacterium]